eukprot:15474075-Alexandrium_andersonii.AAC.1
MAQLAAVRPLHSSADGATHPWDRASQATDWGGRLSTASSPHRSDMPATACQADLREKTNRGLEGALPELSPFASWG